MTTLREAAQQALEALEEYQAKGAPFWSCDAAVAALRAALEQPEQEPVAWRYKYSDGFWRFSNGARVNGCDPIESQALYTAPPQRKPLPKHDQHCVDVPGYGLMAVRLVRAVERVHGIEEKQ